MTDVTVLDLRPVPRPQRHRLVFDAYERLALDAALEIVNDHEPKRLVRELEAELAGACDWEPVAAESEGEWRARITKRSRTALPRVVGGTDAALDSRPDAAGAVWRLEAAARDLDANVIALPAGDGIEPHDGPDLDVVVHILEGSGTLVTERDTVPVAAGDLIWLPRRSRRQWVAGDAGLRYLSVHHRKPTLQITERPA